MKIAAVGGEATEMRDTSPSPRCVGTKLELNFVYRFEGEPTATLRSSLRLKGGDTFEIVARPSVPILSLVLARGFMAPVTSRVT
jgi:hypothetical protein